MSRRGNPYDNAHVESFFKTLKHEKIFANDYSTIDDLTNRLPHFLEEVYNRRRSLRSSLKPYTIEGGSRVQYWKACTPRPHPALHRPPDGGV